MKMMTSPNSRSWARLSHGHEGARDEPNTKVEIGDKAAEEIMDDTTVDGSNDDENDWSDEITEDDKTMADEMKDGSDVKDENSDVGSGAGSRVLGMTGLSCRKEGETQTSDCRYQ